MYPTGTRFRRNWLGEAAVWQVEDMLVDGEYRCEVVQSDLLTLYPYQLRIAILNEDQISSCVFIERKDLAVAD